jgi:hypothetical protein
MLAYYLELIYLFKTLIDLLGVEFFPLLLLDCLYLGQDKSWSKIFFIIVKSGKQGFFQGFLVQGVALLTLEFDNRLHFVMNLLFVRLQD